MMDHSEILEFITRWEGNARKYASGPSASEFMWTGNCERVWTAEFILGLTSRKGYTVPEERIPFVGREPKPATPAEAEAAGHREYLRVTGQLGEEGK